MCANMCTHTFMIYSQDVSSSVIYSQNVTSEYLKVVSLLILMYFNCFRLSCLLNNEKNNINDLQGDKQNHCCFFKWKLMKCRKGIVLL